MGNPNKIEIGYGDVLYKTAEAITQGAEVVIHKGGTGSGKTMDIMLYLLFAQANDPEQPKQIITVVSE